MSFHDLPAGVIAVRSEGNRLSHVRDCMDVYSLLHQPSESVLPTRGLSG